MAEREQFTFYSSFAKSIKRIKKAADRAAAYDAIVDYALYGILPDLDKLPDAAAIVFELSKPNLDSSRRKAENGKRGGNSEAKGKQEQTGSKPEANGKQTGSKKEIEDKKEIEKEKENECYISPQPPTGGKRFVPPTVEEVKAYCIERGNSVDPEAFVDFYTSKGWKIGNNPMKDWRAAVRTWERNDKGKHTGTAESSTPKKWNVKYVN
jgi:hypothetical protein